MTEHEYERLCEREPTLISGTDLEDQKSRTLLWGYTINRDSWHVYLKDGVIHTVMYRYDGILEEQVIKRNEDYVPSKRAYPEACDYEFCKLLCNKGVCIPFTCFNAERTEQQYYGEILK